MTIVSERVCKLSHAAKTLRGGAVHISTMHRWRLRGIRGVRLETFMRGGVRYTSHEAIDRFFAATTATADGSSGSVEPLNQQCKHELEAAEKEFTEPTRRARKVTT
jgi:hypothetical protein